MWNGGYYFIFLVSSQVFRDEREKLNLYANLLGFYYRKGLSNILYVCWFGVPFWILRGVYQNRRCCLW